MQPYGLPTLEFPNYYIAADRITDMKAIMKLNKRRKKRRQKGYEKEFPETLQLLESQTLITSYDGPYLTGIL